VGTASLLQEEAQTLDDLSPRATAIRKLGVLMQRLPVLTEGYRALHQSELRHQHAVLALVDERLQFRKELTLRAILDGLVTLQDDEILPSLVQRLQAIAPLGLPELGARGGLGEAPSTCCGGGPPAPWRCPSPTPSPFWRAWRLTQARFWLPLVCFSLPAWMPTRLGLLPLVLRTTPRAPQLC